MQLVQKQQLVDASRYCMQRQPQIREDGGAIAQFL